MYLLLIYHNVLSFNIYFILRKLNKYSHWFKIKIYLFLNYQSSSKHKKREPKNPRKKNKKLYNNLFYYWLNLSVGFLLLEDDLCSATGASSLAGVFFLAGAPALAGVCFLAGTSSFAGVFFLVGTSYLAGVFFLAVSFIFCRRFGFTSLGLWRSFCLCCIRSFNRFIFSSCLLLSFFCSSFLLFFRSYCLSLCTLFFALSTFCLAC